MSRRSDLFNRFRSSKENPNQKQKDESSSQEQQKEETKVNQAQDDKPKQTNKEKESIDELSKKATTISLQGESSSQPEKEPEAENNRGKEPEEAENTKEDKGNPNIIYPGEFDITWGNDTNYWIQPTKEKPKERAELKKVCWLQVTGSKDVARGKSYEIKFNITLKTDAFGWNGLPLFLMAKIGAKGKSIWKKIKPLEQTTTDKTFEIPDEKFIVPIPAGEGNEKLFFGLYEIWSNKWKGGLYINHATVEEEVRPEHVEEVRPEPVEEVRPEDVAVNEG